MSYNQDVFIDNCVMRLVQLACAIRQNSDVLARQELDSMAREFDADEIECQPYDACEE